MKNLRSELMTHNSKELLNFSYNFKNSSTSLYFMCWFRIENNKVKNQNFLTIMNNLANKLNENDTLICRGTLPLGFTNKLHNKFKYISSKKNFGYCPERIVEGNAVEELENLPQIVSAINDVSLKKISEFCNKTFINNIVTETMEEAELIKLMSNSYRDLIFSFSNEIMTFRIFNIDARKLIDNANHGYIRNNIPMPSPGVRILSCKRPYNIFKKA